MDTQEPANGGIMQGVTILNEFQAVVGHQFGWNAAGVIFLIMLIVSAIAWFALLISDEIPFMMISLLLVMFSLVGFLANTVDSVPAYETQYQVIVDDTCDMNEFFEYYDLIERQGEIYVVRERTE